MASEQWQSHVEAFQLTHLSKRAYANEHDLPYHKFLYWPQKHTSNQHLQQSQSTAEDFVGIAIKKPALPQNLGTVEFPCGARLVIHHEVLLHPLITACLGGS